MFQISDSIGQRGACTLFLPVREGLNVFVYTKANLHTNGSFWAVNGTRSFRAGLPCQRGRKAFLAFALLDHVNRSVARSYGGEGVVVGTLKCVFCVATDLCGTCYGMLAPGLANSL